MIKNTRLKLFLPWILVALVLAVTAIQLRLQGRLWGCSCGQFRVWLSSAWSPETSQQLFDPYAFTHLLHGVGFFGLLWLVLPKLAVRWRFLVAVAMEAAWEIIENTNTVIERYREMTAALGYQGDTILNSLGDVVACAGGFWLAKVLGLWRSLAAFALVELMLLITIRDSLVLNILMLIYPFESLKAWQAGP